MSFGKNTLQQRSSDVLLKIALARRHVRDLAGGINATSRRPSPAIRPLGTADHSSLQRAFFRLNKAL
jgi:hypothetical protein